MLHHKCTDCLSFCKFNINHINVTLSVFLQINLVYVCLFTETCKQTQSSYKRYHIQTADYNVARTVFQRFWPRCLLHSCTLLTFTLQNAAVQLTCNHLVWLILSLRKKRSICASLKNSQLEMFYVRFPHINE